jgi:hypothetical protein
LKSPVRENRPPGSVRGAPGNWRPYLDKTEMLKSDTALTQFGDDAGENGQQFVGFAQ